MAGDSISAIAATMWPPNGTFNCDKNEVAAMNVTALIEP
jgi:hypothetical protein